MKKRGLITCLLASNWHEAVALARSAQMHSPTTGRAAVVEGQLSPAVFKILKSCFDEVIALRPEHFGLGWQVKNAMFSYSPFECTLFLDADCLVVKNLEPAFGQMEGMDICFSAKKIPEQERGASLYSKLSLEKLYQHFQVDWWPQILGGGHFYFEKSPRAQRLFEKTLEWNDLNRLLPFGWDNPRISDELTLQMALVEAGVSHECTLCDFPLVLWVPGLNGDPDVHTGVTRYPGADVKLEDRSHYVLHFGGNHHCWKYQRERWRLAFYFWMRNFSTGLSRVGNRLNGQAMVGAVAFIAFKARRLKARWRHQEARSGQPG